MIGKEIHHYKILEKLGEGGMGVVYKAQDTKLDRIVALKFLPTHSLGNDDDRKRFETEAKAAAALNHPNIATVYEINDHEGDTFIAMEFVDGDTLEDKIKKAPLKIKDAMRIAKQVADGLAAAHEKDIFHRDIKGSNVMVTAKGVVKIMDFGLAKMSSATIVTKAGMTLGTVGYMSPEQSKGEEVDHRTDIWSLGVVFYEMIAGVRPFKGEYETALVYSILNVDPEPLTGLRTGVPMDLEKIINKLLAKDPDERYQNIIELPVDLKNVDLKEVGTSRIGSSVITNSLIKEKEVSVKFKYSNQMVFSFATGAILFSFLIWFLKPEPHPPASRTVRKYSLPLAENTGFFFSTLNRMAISPDGSKIVYLGGDFYLYLRDLFTSETRLIEGSEDGRNPFFSPDGRWLGFFTIPGHELKTALAEGGVPLIITEMTIDNNEGSASWGPGSTIIYTDERILKQIATSSGTPKSLTSLDTKTDIHLYPHVLPGEKAMLFTISSNFRETADNRIAVFSFETGTQNILLDEEGYNAVYSRSGHLVYGRSGMVMAVPFDVESLKIKGEPVPILDEVNTNRTGSMSFALSDEGTMVYVPGQEGGSSQTRMVSSLDTEGNANIIYDNDQFIQRARYSPDGHIIALQIIDNQNSQNITLYNVNDRSSSQLTFLEDVGVVSFAWSPGSDYIAYTAEGIDLQTGIFVKKTDNSRAEIRIYSSDTESRVTAWSEDGRYLVFQEQGDLYKYSFEDSTAQPYFAAQGDAWDAHLSPNGRFAAYISDEGGMDNVYVRSFPNNRGGMWKVSNEVSLSPVWSTDGTKLYYFTLNGLSSVDVDISGNFNHGNPIQHLLLDPSEYFFLSDYRVFDVHPDSKSFMLIQNKIADNTVKQSEAFLLTENWFEELKRLAPVKKE